MRDRFNQKSTGEKNNFITSLMIAVVFSSFHMIGMHLHDDTPALI